MLHRNNHANRGAYAKAPVSFIFLSHSGNDRGADDRKKIKTAPRYAQKMVECRFGNGAMTLSLLLGRFNVVTGDYIRRRLMVKINLKEAKAGLSGLVDHAIKGEFVTITRHGKPVATLVSIEAAEIAREAMDKTRLGLAAYLRSFPGDEVERNRSPSRPVEL